MKIPSLSKKQYILAFTVVMSLNTLLVVLLLTDTFAQVSDDNLITQPPLKAEVLTQIDSPLLISIANTDISNANYQSVNYAVTNISDRSVRAFTVVGTGKSTGKIITRYFTDKLFPPNGFDEGALSIERQNIKSEETLSLAIDYVEFEDGRSWGNDDHKQSEKIAGERAGRTEVLRKLKDLLKVGDYPAISVFLGQELANVTVPNAKVDQAENWQRGFHFGYKATISSLQRVGPKNAGASTVKISEMEKLIK